MQIVRLFGCLIIVASVAAGQAGSSVVQFDVRSARSGKWSDANTWVNGRAPRSGDNVQVRSGHVIAYDVSSDAAVRVLHVAGTLSFARDRSTRLDAGLLKISPDEECSEDGFNCHETSTAVGGRRAPASLEIGTPENPMPPGVSATVRLVYFNGMDSNALPA